MFRIIQPMLLNNYYNVKIFPPVEVSSSWSSHFNKTDILMNKSLSGKAAAEIKIK